MLSFGLCFDAKFLRTLTALHKLGAIFPFFFQKKCWRVHLSETVMEAPLAFRCKEEEEGRQLASQRKEVNQTLPSAVMGVHLGLHLLLKAMRTDFLDPLVKLQGGPLQTGEMI